MFFKRLTLSTLLSLASIRVARGNNFSVTVGGPGVLKFDPEFVTANPGDQVFFSFRQENHTVSESSFDSPCSLAEGGFDSGFVPVADNNTAGPFPEAEYTVQDTNPVWIFCRQANHCQQGMVFAINPGNQSQFDAFQAGANGSAVNASVSSSASPSASSSASASGVSSAQGSSSSVASSGSASPSVVTVTATVTVPPSATSSSASSSASPASATSADHTVVVGGTNRLFFNPSNITADAGDTVTFRFMQTNHSVTQSSLASPCVSLTESSTNGEVGFDSGFMPVSDNTTAYPTFTIQINNTAPIWAFCKQTNPMSHCGAGMVFSVNADASGSDDFDAFQTKAIQLNGTQAAAKNSAEGVLTVGRGAGAVAVLLGILAGIFL
ncbi:hypothetical protein SCP_0410410 [Sparassis crispa]|uniref:Cupredoxin n=1 Tax=Sparassis crispa TaxID=139825 RepID=A0A401GKG7_9APHY|nr:hypothetical protein SCP_0410410 [Sparassis crispa]GBE82656.1 hypothetical protein SCP_0410410 [Sparassis crispa]